MSRSDEFKALLSSWDSQHTGPLLMGVLNVTPDSFSDGGKYLSPEKAISHGRALAEAGATIIDIGGESTGPGASPVSVEEELRRIESVVATLAKDHFVSIDTYHAETAARSVELGAVMINDVSALRADAEIGAVIAEHQAVVALMFSKELGTTPHVSNFELEQEPTIETIIEFLQERLAFATSLGIAASNVVLDPGMGRFLSSNPEVSWRVLRELPQLTEVFSDQHVLVGTSRKSFLGGNLKSRESLSQVTSLIAWLHGASIVRVHDVATSRSVIESWLKATSTKRSATLR